MHLKNFWTQFKIMHCQGPCSLRPCVSRPYCTFFSFCLFITSACVKNLSLLVSQFYKKIPFYQTFCYHICRIEKCRSRTLASAAGCILCKYNKLHTAFKGSSLQNTYSHTHTGLICSDFFQITTLTACIALKIQSLWL